MKSRNDLPHATGKEKKSVLLPQSKGHLLETISSCARKCIPPCAASGATRVLLIPMESSFQIIKWWLNNAGVFEHDTQSRNVNEVFAQLLGPLLPKPPLYLGQSQWENALFPAAKCCSEELVEVQHNNHNPQVVFRFPFSLSWWDPPDQTLKTPEPQRF